MHAQSRKVRGRESRDIARQEFDRVLDDWIEAEEADKPRCANIVLMHAGGMGKKLPNLIEDQQMVRDIIADDKRYE